MGKRKRSGETSMEVTLPNMKKHESKNHTPQASVEKKSGHQVIKVESSKAHRSSQKVVSRSSKKPVRSSQIVGALSKKSTHVYSKPVVGAPALPKGAPAFLKGFKIPRLKAVDILPEKLEDVWDQQIELPQEPINESNQMQEVQPLQCEQYEPLRQFLSPYYEKMLCVYGSRQNGVFAQECFEDEFRKDMTTLCFKIYNYFVITDNLKETMEVIKEFYYFDDCIKDMMFMIITLMLTGKPETSSKCGDLVYHLVVANIMSKELILYIFAFINKINTDTFLRLNSNFQKSLAELINGQSYLTYEDVRNSIGKSPLIGLLCKIRSHIPHICQFCSQDLPSVEVTRSSLNGNESDLQNSKDSEPVASTSTNETNMVRILLKAKRMNNPSNFPPQMTYSTKNERGEKVGESFRCNVPNSVYYYN